MDDVFCYVKALVIFDYLVVRVCTDKIYYYGYTRVVFDHLNVLIHTNQIYEENAVVLDLRCAGFHGTIACIGYFCHFNLDFIILLTISLRGFMKLVQ